MKRLIILVLLVFCSCGFSQENDRFVRKSFDDGTIKVNWYYFSYITDLSPDFVELVKGDSVVIVFKATDVISNVKMKGDTIYLSLFEPYRGVVYIKNPELDFFGYHLLIDSLATLEEFYSMPDGKKSKL